TVDDDPNGTLRAGSADEIAMADKFDEISQALMQEVARLQAEERALKQKVESLRATEHELEMSCAELMDKLAAWRAEYDAVWAARQFCDWIENRLDTACAQFNAAVKS